MGSLFLNDTPPAESSPFPLHDPFPTGGLPPVEDHPNGDSAGRWWRAAAGLRRETNRLVSRVSAKTSTPHAVVHTQLRQQVPGPPSASASVDVLRARRERLRTML